MLLDEFLQEEKLLLQARVLAVNLMYIKHTEIDDLHLLPYGMQQSIAHEQCSGVDTKDDMFVSDGVLHDFRISELVIFVSLSRDCG